MCRKQLLAQGQAQTLLWPGQVTVSVRMLVEASQRLC
jgi:hypothetical protein